MHHHGVNVCMAYVLFIKLLVRQAVRSALYISNTRDRVRKYVVVARSAACLDIASRYI